MQRRAKVGTVVVFVHTIRIPIIRVKKMNSVTHGQRSTGLYFHHRTRMHRHRLGYRQRVTTLKYNFQVRRNRQIIIRRRNRLAHYGQGKGIQGCRTAHLETYMIGCRVIPFAHCTAARQFKERTARSYQREIDVINRTITEDCPEAFQI